jgi:hypothetical protein
MLLEVMRLSGFEGDGNVDEQGRKWKVWMLCVEGDVEVVDDFV